MSRRLTLHLKAQLEAPIDHIAAGNGDRSRAVKRLVLDRARQLAEHGDEPAAGGPPVTRLRFELSPRPPPS